MVIIITLQLLLFIVILIHHYSVPNDALNVLKINPYVAVYGLIYLFIPFIDQA
jgi:hypothetical protein